MFRYIAFTWLVSSQDQSEVSHRLDQAIRAQGWNSALQATGQRVYMTGNKRAVNDAYPLPSGRGVVLGRLFRRSTSSPAQLVDVTLTTTEAQHIVHSNGQALIEQFWGRYVAFISQSTGQLCILRDPTGTLPCYRVEVHGVTVVLSWLEDLFHLLDKPSLPVDWDAVAAHMALGRLSGRDSCLSGVTQVLPAELSSMAAEGIASRRLWSAADIARHPSLLAPEDAARHLRGTVTHCVQSWASCQRSIVLRLSGGVDSSILLGTLAAAAAAGDIVCLNYYANGTDTDERAYARLAARRHNATLREEAVDEDFRLEDVLDVAHTATPATYIGSMGTSRTDALVAAAHDAHAVFNGAGGDQLFFERRCTWPAADYLRTRGLDRGFFKAVLDAAHLGKVSFWRCLRQALIDRSFRGDPAEDAARFLTLMNADALEAALGRAQRFLHPDWLAAHDLPIGKFHQLGMVITPLEYYNHYLGDAAPERVSPLLSQPLIELCLATPTFVLTDGGRGRGLARAAFADRIPAEIASRRSKGGTGQYISRILQRNLTFAREMLLEGLLAKRNLLDRPSVEATLAGRLDAKATHVTEIHACIAMEAWLQRMTRPDAAHQA